MPFKFVDSKSQKPDDEENLSILVQSGKFAAFLADMKSRLAAAGASELDVQRGLYRVHLDQTVHNQDGWST